ESQSGWEGTIRGFRETGSSIAGGDGAATPTAPEDLAFPSPPSAVGPPPGPPPGSVDRLRIDRSPLTSRESKPRFSPPGGAPVGVCPSPPRRNHRRREAMRSWGLAAAIVLLALTGPVRAGNLEDALESRWRGAWVLTSVDIYSECAGIHTDNGVSG